MRLRAALLLPFLCLIPSIVAAAEPSADDIVAGADRIRNPDTAFSFTNTLVEYVSGRENDRAVLTVYSREDEATGEFSNLVRLTDPPRDRGKMMLFNGTVMWFYDPSSKASVRISPQQRLMGQASNGDVVSVNFARDYRASLIGTESLQDADRQARDCWSLELRPINDEALYGRVEYWVEQGSYRPVKGKFYADSGRLLKIAYYRRYSEQLGVERPTETIIIDGVDSKLVTTMATSDYRQQDIPDAWFQRDYLPRVPSP